jgi:hypothetical protein
MTGKKRNPRIKKTKLIEPKPTPTPANVMRERMANSQTIARPQYASAEVKIVTVRHLQGYQTGIGLNGEPVAELKTDLNNAQKMLNKVKKRYGRLVTRVIPKVGLDILVDEKLVDQTDFDTTDPSKGRALLHSKRSIESGFAAPAPAPASGMKNGTKI